MAKERKIVYSDKDKAIVKVLTANPDGLTLSEICEATAMDIKSGTINSAVLKGLVDKVGTREVVRNGKRNVATYTLATADVLNKPDGKPFNYTDGEKKLMAVLKDADAPMILAEIAEGMGVEKLSSGAVNGLVKKGNVVKAGEVTVTVPVKAEVTVYAVAKILPETFTAEAE